MSDQIITETKPTNPLIPTSKKLPGITVRLPSHGSLYREGILADGVVNGELHVYPMTAMDEILFKSPDKLLSGDAVRQVFKNCIPEVLIADALLTKDVDYLLVALRKISYGDEYTISYTHTCDDAKSHDYMIDINQFMTKSKDLDASFLKQNQTLEVMEHTVTFRPMSFRDVTQIMNDLSDGQTEEQELEGFLKNLIRLIVRVDSTADKEFIMEWLTFIPAKEVKLIFNHIEKLNNWGPSYKSDITCRDCGKIVELEIPVNPMTFFM